MTFTRDWLNDASRKAVEHMVGSRDRVTLLRGAAGVGKTTLMQEAVEADRDDGNESVGLRSLGGGQPRRFRDEGFKDADTVARLLVDEKLQQQAAGQLILGR